MRAVDSRLARRGGGGDGAGAAVPARRGAAEAFAAHAQANARFRALQDVGYAAA